MNDMIHHQISYAFKGVLECPCGNIHHGVDEWRLIRCKCGRTFRVKVLIEMNIPAIMERGPVNRLENDGVSVRVANALLRAGIGDYSTEWIREELRKENGGELGCLRNIGLGALQELRMVYGVEMPKVSE